MQTKQNKIVISIVLILIIVGLTYFFFGRNSDELVPISSRHIPAGGSDGTGEAGASQTGNVLDSKGNSVISSQAPPPLLRNREYHNTAQNFSLSYPEDLSVDEYDQGDNTYTIVFTDAHNLRGFQIFFTPYPDDTITRSAILREIPNGKFTQPDGIVLGDGTKAIIFFSTVENGDMREVWFIKNGILFQVTTWKDLDSWLATIMNTWKFTQ